MNDKLFDKAIDAINKYVADRSVSSEETMRGLRDLRDQAEMWIDAIERDKKND